MTPEDVEAAVGRAIDAKLGQFYIDRETHFKDHEFIQGMRKWTEEAKGVVLRSVLKFLTAITILACVAGFILWGREHFGK